jgi:metacaspase-1
MPKGLTLTIGLNAVDPKHYAGWDGALNACEADADDMADIAKTLNFTVKTLLTKAATRQKVSAEIRAAAKSLKSGDIFMLTYSGHGGQLPDLNHDEPDRQDETWCLYDGELVDDELFSLLGKFAKGIRILVFSDSCHSGTVIKAVHYQGIASAHGAGGCPPVRYRVMPPDVALRTYRLHRDLYDPILLKADLAKAKREIKASVILISGCQDNQYSSDGDFNGLFTGTLLQVWHQGKFKGSYRRFHKVIVQRMPPEQTPNFFRIGVEDETFAGQAPFTI